MKAWINNSWWKLKWHPENNELSSGVHNHRFEVELPWYMALLRVSMWVLGILTIPLLIAGAVVFEHVAWWGILFCVFSVFSWVYIIIAENKYDEWLEKAIGADEEEYNRTVIEPHNKEQQRLADEWRENHPLEEACRLAMLKNPNYVADLIRYVKEKRDDELC